MDVASLKRQWPFLEHALDLTTAQVGLLRTEPDNHHLELEARLGRVHMRADGSFAFESGVSAAFMARVLWKLETSAAWTCTGDWAQQVDRFYALPGGKPVRTTTRAVPSDASSAAHASDCETLDTSASSLTVSHVSKTSVVVNTFKWNGPLAAECYDVRVSLQRETPVSIKDLPVRVDVPHFIRVKQRKSFTYTPQGAAQPAFQMDVSLVFQAKTLDAAYELLRTNAVSSYEIELECINVAQYLAHIKQDTARLASSLLAKLCDFFTTDALKTGQMLAL